MTGRPIVSRNQPPLARSARRALLRGEEERRRAGVRCSSCDCASARSASRRRDLGERTWPEPPRRGEVGSACQPPPTRTQICAASEPARGVSTIVRTPPPPLPGRCCPTTLRPPARAEQIQQNSRQRDRPKEQVCDGRQLKQCPERIGAVGLLSYLSRWLCRLAVHGVWAPAARPDPYFRPRRNASRPATAEPCTHPRPSTNRRRH